jgi:hypothetical protein
MAGGLAKHLIIQTSNLLNVKSHELSVMSKYALFRANKANR